MSRGFEDEIGSFLARWSRRKAAARRGRPEPEPEVESKRESSTGGAAAPSEEGGACAVARGDEHPIARSEAPTIDIASLPDPDTLDASADFSQFMRPGVPLDLQRRALRRLWRINPIISTPSEIDDYYIVNDFSDASTVVADLKTLYRVGRGMVAALDEQAEGSGPECAGTEEPAEPTAEVERTEVPGPDRSLAQEQAQGGARSAGPLANDGDLLSRA